jgi:hypothetical protein
MFTLYNIIDNDNNETDSIDEVYFEWWLQELKDNGYVESYHRAKSLTISDNITSDYSVKNKTRSVIVTKNILQPIVYTPDYVIVWTDKANGIFFLDIYGSSTLTKEKDKPLLYHKIWAQQFGNKYVSIVDVKPSVNQRFVKFTSSHTFVVKQALLYKTLCIFVDKIKVISLMKSTFTPDRYLRSDKNTTVRKIKFNIKSLQTYLSEWY